MDKNMSTTRDQSDEAEARESSAVNYCDRPRCAQMSRFDKSWHRCKAAFEAGWLARSEWNFPAKPIEPSPLNDEEIQMLKEMEERENVDHSEGTEGTGIYFPSKAAESDYRKTLPYGGYCNNPECSMISVGGSTKPDCSCGWEYSDTPGKRKAAESESFSLSKPKQIEDVMDDIANEKPASSSEFDLEGCLENAFAKFGVEYDDDKTCDLVVAVGKWQHARDAEEIAQWKRDYETIKDTLYEVRLSFKELTEENQRLIKYAKAKTELIWIIEERDAMKKRIEKLTAALRFYDTEIIFRDPEDTKPAREALAADSGGADE